MSEDVFRRYSAFYDLLYQDKDYPAEADYVARTLRAACPGIDVLLELGSGTGLHGRLLAEHGFHVTGVERSETMIEAARTAAARLAAFGPGTFECVLGDIRSVDLARQFDAAISLFHVVSYQTGNADLEQTFATAARHVRPGGVFFFDVWHGPAVLSDRPATRVKRVENEEIRLWRIAEPEIDLQASVVVVRYTILAESKTDGHLTTLQEEHRMRYLFPTEISWLADRSGFDVERAEEFLTGAAPSHRTWGVAYLLRRRG